MENIQSTHSNYTIHLGKPQKSFFFDGRTTERGGVKGWTTTQKKTFFEARKKIRKQELPLRSRGGGVGPIEDLSGRNTEKKITFCLASLTKEYRVHNMCI